MAEVGIAYVLTGPDGTRAVVGNCDAAVADPDFVGYLDPENGVTGLMDGADVRENGVELVAADGGSHGPFFLGRRPGTMQGLILPNSDMPAVNAAITKLKRATRALRADGTLTWTPSGDSVQRQIVFRRQARPAITGRRPKQWQIALVSADAYVLSASEASVILVPGGAVGELGIPNPIKDPITSALNTSGQQLVVNQGDAPTWPRFRIDGPMTNPEILNFTTGEALFLNATLGVGDWLDVYPERGAIVLNGTGDRYSYLNFALSTWWQLQPGQNDIRLLASSFSGAAQLTVFWRHAYE